MHVHPVADRFVIIDRGGKVGDFLKTDVSLEALEHRLRLVAETGQIEGGSDPAAAA